MGLALLATASMPLKYWDQVFLAATHLVNRTPTKLLAYDTPLHHQVGATPDYSSLRVFGCTCWPNLCPYNSHKHQFRSIRYAFLSYSNLHKGYKCLDIFTGRVYISKDVVFDEAIFLFANLHSNDGACYTSDVLLLQDPTRANSGANLDNVLPNVTPANVILSPLCVQPQTISPGDSAPAPSTDPGVAPSSTYRPVVSNQCVVTPLEMGPTPTPAAPTTEDTMMRNHQPPCCSPSSAAPPHVPLSTPSMIKSVPTSSMQTGSTPSAPASTSVLAFVSASASASVPMENALRTRLQSCIRKPIFFGWHNSLW
jgi:hypothetical protein